MGGGVLIVPADAGAFGVSGSHAETLTLPSQL